MPGHVRHHYKRCLFHLQELGRAVACLYFQESDIMKKLILKLVVLPFIGLAFAGCITI